MWPEHWKGTYEKLTVQCQDSNVFLDVSTIEYGMKTIDTFPRKNTHPRSEAQTKYLVYYLRGFVDPLKPSYIFAGDSWTLDIEERTIFVVMMLLLKSDSTNPY